MLRVYPQPSSATLLGSAEQAERPGLVSTERTNLMVAAWPLPSQRLS